MTKNEALSRARQNQFLTQANFPLLHFFPAVQVFVFKAAIDLLLEEDSYAKRYKLHLPTNIQSTIELSFIFFCGVSLNFLSLCYRKKWCCEFHSFFFFFLKITQPFMSFQRLHLSLRSDDLNDPLDELPELGHVRHLPEIESFSCGKSEPLTLHPTSPLNQAQSYIYCLTLINKCYTRVINRCCLHNHDAHVLAGFVLARSDSKTNKHRKYFCFWCSAVL